MSPPPGVWSVQSPLSPPQSRGTVAPATPWTPPKVPQAAPASNPPAGTMTNQHPSFIMGYNQAAAKFNALSPRHGKPLPYLHGHTAAGATGACPDYY